MRVTRKGRRETEKVETSLTPNEVRRIREIFLAVRLGNLALLVNMDQGAAHLGRARIVALSSDKGDRQYSVSFQGTPDDSSGARYEIGRSPVLREVVALALSAVVIDRVDSLKEVGLHER